MQTIKSPKTKTFKLDKADIARILAWGILFFFTWLFMHGAERFLSLTPEALGKYFKVKYVIIAHITAGGGALLTGFIQFWPKLRNYSRKLHRVIGFAYLLAVLVSSICAGVLAFTTAYEVNWAYAFSVQVWAGVWISSTFIAYYAAAKRKFNLHRQWMTKSYLVTIAFLISGLLLKTEAVQSLGSFEDISPSFFWLGWAVPLYVYEIVLSRKAKS
jgi:uncharacterized membrane protein